MRNSYYGYKEETVLSPTDTRFNIDCYILDATHINSANRMGEFELMFMPVSNTDYIMLEERVRTAVSTVMMNMSPYSSKTPKSCMEKDRKPYCSQLFTPKVNIDFEHPDVLSGRQASLTMHLRDTVDGSIYLQCEYCDVYEPVTAPAVIKEEVEPADEDDF